MYSYMLSSRFFSIFLSLFFRHLGRMLDLPTTARSRLLSLIPMLGNRHVNHETNRNGSTILIVLSIVPSMRCKASNFSTLKVDLIHTTFLCLTRLPYITGTGLPSTPVMQCPCFTPTLTNEACLKSGFSWPSIPASSPWRYLYSVREFIAMQVTPFVVACSLIVNWSRHFVRYPLLRGLCCWCTVIPLGAVWALQGTHTTKVTQRSIKPSMLPL